MTDSQLWPSDCATLKTLVRARIAKIDRKREKEMPIAAAHVLDQERHDLQQIQIRLEKARRAPQYPTFAQLKSMDEKEFDEVTDKLQDAANRGDIMAASTLEFIDFVIHANGGTF